MVVFRHWAIESYKTDSCKKGNVEGQPLGRLGLLLTALFLQRRESWSRDSLAGLERRMSDFWALTIHFSLVHNNFINYCVLLVFSYIYIACLVFSIFVLVQKCFFCDAGGRTQGLPRASQVLRHEPSLLWGVTVGAEICVAGFLRRC